MAILPESYANGTFISGVCAKPTGTAVGDVLIAQVTAIHSSAAAVSGFTLITSTETVGSVRITALYRVVDGSEGATFTATGGTVLEMSITRFSGVDVANVIDGTPSAAASTASTAVTPASTTTTNNESLLVLVGYVAGGAGGGVTTLATDPAMVEVWEFKSTSGSTANLGTETRATAGATGTRTLTSSGGTGTTGTYAILFALRATQPPPPVPLPDNSATYRAPTSVLIADPAGFNQQRVPVNSVPRSWVVGGSGALSAEIMSRDLVRFGLHDELRGHEIVVHDDDAGAWGGIISDAQPNGDGTTEIAATSWEASFAKKRLPRRSRALFGPAGTLALNAITEATRETGTAIVDRTATDFGIPVTLNYDGGDLLAALDSMADETGQEWWIDPDTRAFRWGVKGRDLTGSVHLIAGRHIVDWRMPTSLEPVINDLLAFPTNDDYSVWQAVRVTNPASIAAVGIRQGSAAIPGGTHAVHIRGRAQGLVNELAALGQAIEFDLANVDRCFRWFREGDQICITVPSISVQVTCRVMARSINDDGTMSVSADVLTRRDV